MARRDLALAISRLPAEGSGIGVLADDRAEARRDRRRAHEGLGPARVAGTVVLSSLANSAAAVDPSTAGTPIS